MATHPDYAQHVPAEPSGHDLDRSLELLATLRSFERLIDAAEHVVLTHDEGLNLDSAIAALAAATPKREGRSPL